MLEQGFQPVVLTGTRYAAAAFQKGAEVKCQTRDVKRLECSERSEAT